MSEKIITVTALVRAQPGRAAEVRRELLSLVEPSRRDAGCLKYDLHQAADDPNRFLFDETWQSEAHLHAHLEKPDLQTVLARVGQMVAEAPQITIWEKIS